MAKYNPRARHRSRKFALQALYQWLITQDDLIKIEQQYLNDNDMKHVDVEYFHELLHQIPAHLNQLQDSFKSFLDRPIEELNPIELTVLRIASYELLMRKDIPYKVAINEALELTKLYGATDGYKYVNGVLDQVASQLKQQEK